MALREWSQRLDGARPASFEVPRADWRAAYEGLPAPQRQALDLAAGRVEAFHAKQPVDSWVDAGADGVVGQLVRPLARVGVYVPGGTAPLPSSLLMAAIPARVAGVREIVCCTPPGRDGSVSDLVLAAAHRAGVDALYMLGGAQAIAAMAFGTDSIRGVDKIVGAGGLFVTLAKRQVFGRVGIDGFYGPTETLVIADDSADPAWVAADLLAQAEHDILASPLLVTPSARLADRVQAELAVQLEDLGRAEIAAAALAGRGGIVLARDLEEAVALSNAMLRSTCASSSAIPGAWWEWSRTPAASSSGTTPSKSWATTWPARVTSCPRRAPRVTPARSASPTSSSASAWWR
jgi:histidinol dehydrogenase